MSTAPPTNETRAASALRVPPDEQFWKRYSPHGEAPLSLAGSVALHVLIGAGLILFAWYVVSLFSNQTGSLPVEPVRLAIKPPGGGGDKTGSGEGPGTGGKEDVGEPGEENQPGADDAPRRPSLSPVETEKIKQNFVPRDVRYIQKSETGKALALMEESARNKLRQGLSPGGKGKGGTGSDGGKDTGKGKGDGPGVGAGSKATLNQREKRMLRWHMRFTANFGAEYLAQLNSLGAILAFPIEAKGGEPTFMVTHNLVRGGKLAEEDLSGMQRIFWIDNNPKSVNDILVALGARNRFGRLPSHFVAFMPEELEKQLFEMERRYVEKVLRRKFDEDRIEETQFRVVPTGRRYKPELISVSMH